MEYLVYLLILVGGFFVGFFLKKQNATDEIKQAQEKADKILSEVKNKQSDVIMKAQEKALKIIDDAKLEERKRRQELSNQQSRLEKRENTFSQKLLELQDKQQKLFDKVARIE